MADKSGDILTGVIIGGLLGFVAGILLAPKSGRETRRELITGAEELLEKAKKEYEQALEKSKKSYEAAISHIQNLDLEKKIDSLEADLKSISSEAIDSVQEGTSRVKRAIEAGVEAFKEEKRL